MDGVRKKAKYLHDAPDGALLPGVGASYHHMDGNHQQPLPGQDPGTVSMVQEGSYYTQAPSATYYAKNFAPQPTTQEGPIAGAFQQQQAPISPPYSQTNPAIIASVPSTRPQGSQSQMQQYSGPLFDPSDPALFNFDISSLNFGNHYGALELGMLGHLSSGAVETPPSDNNMMNPINRAAGMYNPQMSYSDNPNLPAHISFGPTGMPANEWHHAHSRQGSLQMQTPNNTPTTANLDHSGHRHDSLNGPHAYTIGQGPSSLSSASPASTDMNAYDNDNPLSAAAFFAHTNQQQAHQRVPTVNRLHQENRPSNAVLQPIHSNALRKRRRDTRWIYEEITKPYDYLASFHSFFLLLKRKCTSLESRRSCTASLGRFRPILTQAAGDLDRNDLVHSERNLQRSLLTLKEHQAELATPSILCRRSGEVVGMNAEFTQLTGWTSDVLLGKAPNLNVNTGLSPDQSNESTQTNTTPNMDAQEPQTGPRPVNIIELMDERSALEWLEDFSNLAYGDPRGTAARRVNMIRYRTKEDVARLEEVAKAHVALNGKHMKREPKIKQESGPLHESELNIDRVVSKDGLMDCMITWLIKRDNFDIPMLVSMQVSLTPMNISTSFANSVARSCQYYSQQAAHMSFSPPPNCQHDEFSSCVECLALLFLSLKDLLISVPLDASLGYEKMMIDTIGHPLIYAW
jgi:hypothetical protein